MISVNYKSASVDNTIRIGQALGESLPSKFFIELRSDLGGGKTTLVSGLAKGLQSIDPVSSPSFTICNTYRTKKKTVICHFDFYRLEEAGIIAHELAEAVNDSESGVVVEWGGLVDGLLPEDRITVTISTISDFERLISITSPSMITLQDVESMKVKSL